MANVKITALEHQSSSLLGPGDVFILDDVTRLVTKKLTVANLSTYTATVIGNAHIVNSNVISYFNNLKVSIGVVDSNVNSIAGIVTTNINTVSSNIDVATTAISTVNSNLVSNVSSLNSAISTVNANLVSNVSTLTTAINTVNSNVIALINRVITVTDSNNISINADMTDIVYQLNTQATGTLTINAPTGSIFNGQKLVIKIKSANTQTFSWNAVYSGSTDLALPTNSTGNSKIDYTGFIYDTTTSKWHILAKNFGF